MKSLIFMASALFFSSDNYASLTIQIQGLKQIKGKIQIGIYNDANQFPKVGGEYRVEYVDASANTLSYTAKNLPNGEYAIALFHDVNSDGVCNLNFLGIPKEPYGFSKNIKPVWSAPTFSKTKVAVNANTQISIDLIN
jgi:uncharacterized protein (DUF2141 family)